MIAPTHQTIAIPDSGQAFLFQSVDWDFYDKFLDLLNDQRVRVTYDRGNLEIMAPSYRHESYGGLLRHMVEDLAIELRIPFKLAGETTFRREDLDRGLQADECYYIQNEARIEKGREIDLTRDPPPDLAIEMEVTRTALDRMGIYAALRVPEVWRCNGENLASFQLQPNGEYAPCDHSLAFPFLRMADLMDFIRAHELEDDGTVLRAFREWVRTKFASFARPATAP